MTEHLYDKYDYVPEESLVIEIREAIKNLDVVPSMRALMTAGLALELENVAGYNCAYMPIDDVAAFGEALYILMNGTGVGYSVEYKYVEKLPPIPEIFLASDIVIQVGDSKLGWAQAYKQLLEHLWLRGWQPGYDLSAIRPAGSRLKTFGGRASGPEPLKELFDYTIDLFWEAQGRKLRPIEVHDLMCKIASVVVVGGVRRSAMICLSDLSDQEMATAKSGEWWVDYPHRRLANISAVYHEDVSIEEFDREWHNLQTSGSGERGIFNRYAAQRQAAKNGKRDPGIDYGTNPCISYDTRMLTSEGLKKIGDLAKTGETFQVYNGQGEFAPSYAWKTGKKMVYRLTLSNGMQIDLTDNHVIEVMEKSYPSQDTYDKRVERTVGELAVGDKIRPFVADRSWSGGRYVGADLATAIGILFGDGYYHKASGNELFIKTQEPEILEHLRLFFYVELSSEHTYRVRGARAVMESMGFEVAAIPDRQIPEQVFSWSADAVRGFLRGLFSANGGAMPKHNRIDLKSVNLEMLRDVQRLLSALGYNAYITTNKPQMIEWPNGTYESRESYDLNIQSAFQYTLFQGSIGFVHEHKSVPCAGESDTPYKLRSVEVVSIEEIGEQDVFDFHEAETHWGWANGFKVHNCGEIILRPFQFCNLSEVIIREDDNYLSLDKKVRLATVLGTWQSTLTDFKFLRPIWRKNTEEERLLGVSLTGIYGNSLTSSLTTPAVTFSQTNAAAWDANAAVADAIGINRSVAICTVKPSGTVSQLAGVSSGIHPWHAKHYIRTIRADKKDPLAQLMVDSGVPSEPDLMNPDSTLVFSFPIKAPDLAVTRDRLSAIDHLELWLAYRRYWCDHNPSVTVSVRPEEWYGVSQWVWEHLDEVTGITFLPFEEHTYQQAPYQSVSYPEWRAAALSFPEVRWQDLSFYELEDATAGSQTLACAADGTGCDSADLVSA
ncbi:LAGLIDADG family homing endonuclease [Nonomuraea jabiensis]|uniref:LAGLIDADG family homing endonuclease n=1 Tax=Nonomuraea jabiensis TaxID=882448 RepID=UPI00344780AD